MAVAEASFKMSIEAILLGSNVASGLVALLPISVDVLTPPPVNGKPSTTYNGSLLALIEVPPLIRILKAASGPPSERTTCTPAALAAMAPSKEAVLIFSISSDLIVDTAPVKSLRLTEPYPTTTTSSSLDTSETRLTSKVDPVTVASWVLNPM